MGQEVKSRQACLEEMLVQALGCKTLAYGKKTVRNLTGLNPEDEDELAQFLGRYVTGEIKS